MTPKNRPNLLDCLLIFPAFLMLAALLLKIVFYSEKALYKGACIGAFSIIFLAMICRFCRGKFNPHFIKPTYRDIYVRILCLILTYTPVYLCFYKPNFSESYGFVSYFYGGFIPYVWDMIYSFKRYKVLFGDKAYQKRPLGLLEMIGLYIAFIYGYFLIDISYLYLSFLVLIILIPMMIKFIKDSIKGFLSNKIN